MNLPYQRLCALYTPVHAGPLLSSANVGDPIRTRLLSGLLKQAGSSRNLRAVNTEAVRTEFDFSLLSCFSVAVAVSELESHSAFEPAQGSWSSCLSLPNAGIVGAHYTPSLH